MPKASSADLSPHTLRVADLNPRAKKHLTLTPDDAERATIAAELGLSAVRKLAFEAVVTAAGKRDWVLDGKLGATIVQPCVVTLEPVVTRIDTDVTRRFLADWEPVGEAGAETEMPEDDSTEPLGDVIDAKNVMLEALSLAAPDFPRSDAAAAFEAVAITEPGRAALTDADVKPFAGLAALKAQMESDDGADG